MDGERAKSNSIFQSLHRSRVEAALMFPCMIKSKNLCNSDSDSVPKIYTKITRKKLDFSETSDKENIDILDEDDTDHRTKRKENTKQKSEVKSYNLDQKKLGKTESDSKNTKLQIFGVVSDNDSLRNQKENNLGNQTRKKSYKKKMKVVRTVCEKPELKKSDSAIQNSSSSSSSDDEDEEHWWKPSRKSLLKLYKQRETTKTFSFLASLSGIFLNM